MSLLKHSSCCQFFTKKVTISTSTPSPRVLPPLSASKALSLPFPQSFSKNHSSVVKEDERVGIVGLFLTCTIEFACFSLPDSEYQIKRVKLLFHLPPYYRCAKIPIKKHYTIGKQLRNHCCFSCQSVLSHCFHSVPYLPVLSKWKKTDHVQFGLGLTLKCSGSV